MGTETRKSTRAPASLKVRFRAATVGQFIEQQLANLSTGGIFIRSKTPLPRGTLLVFEFQLEDGASLIKGVGRVVWTRSPEASGDEPPGMGIKFIRIEPESRQTFEQIMAEKAGGARGRDVVATLGPATGETPASPPEPGEPASDRVEGPETGAPEPFGPVAASSPPPAAGSGSATAAPDQSAPPPSLDIDENVVEEEASEAVGQPSEGSGPSPSSDEGGVDGRARLLPSESAVSETPVGGAEEWVSPPIEAGGPPEPPSHSGGGSARPPAPPPPATSSERTAQTLEAAGDGPAPRRSIVAVGLVVGLALVLVAASVYLVLLLRARAEEDGSRVGDDGTSAVVTPVPPAEPPPAAPPSTVDGGASAADGAADGGDGGAAPGEAGATGASDSGEMVFGGDPGEAPPEAGAPPRILLVRSEPPGTPVSINGERVGRTPVSVTGEERPLTGLVTVRLTRSGYDNWATTIESDDRRWAGGGGRIVIDVTMVERERRRLDEPETGRVEGPGGESPAPAPPAPTGDGAVE